MKQPDWFVLIDQWKAKGMGQYGVSLPFLVGALGYRSAQIDFSSNDVRTVLNEIVNNPVAGYVTEVRWCGNIDAPVFSVSRVDDARRMPFASHFSAGTGEVTLGFSQDLQSMFHLNCSGNADCLEKLIQYAAPYVEQGRFSKVRNQTSGELEYGPFTEKDRLFIEEAICREVG